MLQINQCLTPICRSLSFLLLRREVLCTSTSLCAQYVRLSTGYLVLWAGVHQWQVPCTSGPPSALIPWVRGCSPLQLKPFPVSGHHGSRWELLTWDNAHILWLLTLVAHSQRIQGLCAAFSINSLSFSQLHTLIFQTENAHKQILQIRFVFYYFCLRVPEV